MLLALNWFFNFFSVPDKKYVFRFKVRQENLDPFEVVFQNIEEKKPLLHFWTQIPKPVKNQKLILTRHRRISITYKRLRKFIVPFFIQIFDNQLLRILN